MFRSLLSQLSRAQRIVQQDGSFGLQRSFSSVSAPQFKSGGKKYDVVLDVREPGELAEGFIKDSVLAPLSRFENDQKSGVFDRYKDQQVLVYCRSGRRSAMVCNLLESSGFRDVTNLEGGYESYKST